MNILKQRISYASRNLRDRGNKIILDYDDMLIRLELQQNKCIYCQRELDAEIIGISTVYGEWWACQTCSGRRAHTKNFNRFCSLSGIDPDECRTRMRDIKEAMRRTSPRTFDYPLKLERKYTK